MNKTSGSIYFCTLVVLLSCSLMVIGTSLSINQVNQTTVWKSSKAWEAYWLGKNILNQWKMGMNLDQQKRDGFVISGQEIALAEGILSGKINISWREGELSNQITLCAYKPVIR